MFSAQSTVSWTLHVGKWRHNSKYNYVIINSNKNGMKRVLTKFANMISLTFCEYFSVEYEENCKNVCFADGAFICGATRSG